MAGFPARHPFKNLQTYPVMCFFLGRNNEIQKYNADIEYLQPDGLLLDQLDKREERTCLQGNLIELNQNQMKPINETHQMKSLFLCSHMEFQAKLILMIRRKAVLHWQVVGRGHRSD